MSKMGTIKKIARQELGIKTLATRRSDALDFYDLAVANIKRALSRAYEEGKKSASERR